MLVDVRETPLSVDEAMAHVTTPSAGGIAVFVGVVRETNDGRDVTRLEYQAYASMAKAEMARIASEIEVEIEGASLAALHRTGSLEVSDIAVVCAASAPHRDEAFRACRALIDRIKARVPIWKREHGKAGAAWVGWVDARCGGEHGEEHAHASVLASPEK